MLLDDELLGRITSNVVSRFPTASYAASGKLGSNVVVKFYLTIRGGETDALFTWNGERLYGPYLCDDYRGEELEPATVTGSSD